MPRLAKFNRTPSRVNGRLQLALEKPVQNDTKLARLLHYKSLLILSGARSAEIKNLENYIDQMKCKTSTEVDETDKTSTTMESFAEEKLNLSNQANSEEIHAIRCLPYDHRQKFLVERLRRPKHLQNLSACENDSSTEDKFLGTKSSKDLSSVIGSHSLPIEGKLNGCTNKTFVDDDMDILTTKMENYHISPLGEQKISKINCNEKVLKRRCMPLDETLSGEVFRENHPKLNLSVEANSEEIHTIRGFPYTHRLKLPVGMLRRPKNLSACENDSSTEDKFLETKSSKDLSSVIGSHSLPTEGKLNSCTNKTSVDEEIDVLTTKMENYHITPLGERKTPKCIYNRKVLKTLCLTCGEIMSGGVILRSEYHPEKTFLEDHYYCTNCADSTQLQEVVDISE